MTSNEKKVLMKFKEIKQGNTVTMAGTLRVTIGYAYDVCKKLCEKGYLERLSPGKFASYKITPVGEEQVKGEGEGERELSSVVSAEEEDKKAIEERDEYECVSCGATVREDTMVCPKCGVVFEEVVEEEEAAEAPDFPPLYPEGSRDPEGQDKHRDEALSSAPQSHRVDEEHVDEKTRILNHSTVPEDWEACNWKWD